MISYYEGMLFFLALPLILIPSIWLGWKEKRTGPYALAASAAVCGIIFWGKKEELLWLSVYLAWSMLLVFAYRMVRKKLGRKTVPFHAALVLAILPLAAAKTSGFYHPGLFGFTGISYLTFRVLQILIELYDGVIQDLSFAGTAAFFLFFPSFSSGPIDRSRRFDEDYRKIRKREEYMELCSRGIMLLLVGAVYKFILAALFFKGMGYLDSADSRWYHWIGYAYAYGLYLFFDFAGYSRMAVGTACILGTELPDNFNAPFISRDIKEFWDRWHITLSHWFRDFLFTRFAMLCSKKKWFHDRLSRACAGYMVNMTVMGLWHGVTVSYILYGIYHGLLLALTEVWQKRSGFYKKNKDKKWYQMLSWFVTMQLVFLGFFLFSGKLIELLAAKP